MRHRAGDDVLAHGLSLRDPGARISRPGRPAWRARRAPQAVATVQELQLDRGLEGDDLGARRPRAAGRPPRRCRRWPGRRRRPAPARRRRRSPRGSRWWRCRTRGRRRPRACARGACPPCAPARSRCPSCVGQRRPEDEAPRLDADDQVDAAPPTVGHVARRPRRTPRRRRAAGVTSLNTTPGLGKSGMSRSRLSRSSSERSLGQVDSGTACGHVSAATSGAARLVARSASWRTCAVSRTRGAVASCPAPTPERSRLTRRRLLSSAPCSTGADVRGEHLAAVTRPGSAAAFLASSTISGSWSRMCTSSGRRDEDRGVGTHRDTDEQRQREVEQGARAEEQEPDDEDRRDRQQGHDRGVDRAHQRLVDGEVGRLGVGHPAVARAPRRCSRAPCRRRRRCRRASSRGSSGSRSSSPATPRTRPARRCPTVMNRSWSSATRPATAIFQVRK